ncbi:MAG: DVUA0089 family protein [Gammaproteobacteria bacterium]|nr:DVUA0089 family protein [Gammaproteobacteria bacterium]
MATVKEMMMQDAVANAGTAYMMSAGDTFEGTITNTAGDTEDWIGIEMEAGTKYTISVSGGLAETGGAMDTILTLFDSKGGMIDMNDDDPDTSPDGLGLGSKLAPFTPEVSGTYYISVSTYRNNPNLDNSGMYTVSVTGVMVDPTVGEGKMGTMRVPDDTTTDPNEYISGNDKLKGGDADDKISGLSGDDTLYGMAGDDTLDGGDDNDLLVGGPGADTLKGGGGDDVISYSDSPDGVTINLGDGTARGGDAEGDTIVDEVSDGDRVEGVMGSEYDDSLTGSSAANKLWGLGGNDELDGLRGADELYGGAGDDDLDGGAGDDKLEGGYGADVLTGGAGMDTASYAGSMMGVAVRLHSGQAMGGDAEGDMWTMAGETIKYDDGDEEEQEATVADIEHLTGSAFADILAGDLRDNTIMGGGGDDKIYGGPNPADADKETGGGLINADMLHGGGGNDMLFGGYGADTLKGDAGEGVRQFCDKSG